GADAIGPIAAQPDRSGADEVVAGPGDEGGLARRHADALQRQAVGSRIGLVVARGLGGDDAVPTRAQPARRQQAEALGAIGDDRKLGPALPRIERPLRAAPRLELAPAPL